MNRIIVLSLILFFCSEKISFPQSQDEFVEIAKYTFEIYKQIHQYPELGKKEFNTSKLVKSELLNIGFTDFYSVPSLPTCIITVLDSKVDGPNIAFRSELDAINGNENTGLPYSSKIENVMHACGHDAHTSILLASAKLFYKNKSKFKGKIFFIFQPAEETKGGADDIVNSGILSELKIEKIFTQHCAPDLPVGTISVSPGYFMAGSNTFEIKLEGKDSHAALPYQGDDMPSILSEVISEITQIPSRKMDIANRPCVISITYISFGDSNGVSKIQPNLVLKGTIRAFEPIDTVLKDQLSIKEILEKTIENKCSPKGIKFMVEINKKSPRTFNDETLYKNITPKLSSVFSGKLQLSKEKFMTSEDFSYYTQTIPCLYFGLGIKKDNLGIEPLHTNKFSVHPDSFIYGVELFYRLAQLEN